MFAPPPLPRTLEASLRDLASPRDNVRAEALRDLIGHAELSTTVRARAIPLLEQALSDTAAQVRAQAAVGLADLAANECLPALLVRVEDDDAYVRQMAIRSLGEIGDSRAKGRLERALTDERPEVRYQAIVAYSRVSPDESDARRALTQGLRDKDASIRTIALRALDERCAAADESRTLDATTCELVRTMLSSGESDALTAAIFVLSAGERDSLAIDLVRAAVEGRLHAALPEDVNEAHVVAGQLGLSDLLPTLDRLVYGKPGLGRFMPFGGRKPPASVWHARVALVLLGHERATRELHGDLGSRDPAKRQAAILAAGRARLLSAKPALQSLLGTDAKELAQRSLAEIDGARKVTP